MNATVTEKPTVDEAINKAFSHLRDISLRDGVQSWDGNKWPIEEILPVAKEINKLVKMGKDRGIAMPSVEAWGGGQYAQPARFLGEDTLINQEQLHKIMPDVDIMALFRGRQCLGFAPVSPEVQEQAFEASIKRGVKVFRVFDMMNDIENVAPSIKMLNDLRNKHNANLTIEGAISYISAPDKGKKRATTLKEYGEYAVQLAKAGADEITIKNYAGVGDKEMPDLIKTIRTELDKSGHRGMKINLHDHGQKPDTVVAAIQAGASKVDTAIGDLSGGVSHTNMRTAIYAMLEADGIDISQRTTQTAINNHPMMKQLAHIEHIITETVNKPREIDGKTTSFKAKRSVLETITQEDADHYRVAGGAMSDVAGRIESFYAQAGKNGNPPTGFPSKEEYFRLIMEKSLELWEKAGQFNTVTPGALILTEQATKLATRELMGQKPTLDQYNDAYVDIALGRYGRNRGMEKGLGDTQWAENMMIYRALKTMNTSLEEGKITENQLVSFVIDTGLNKDGIKMRVRKDVRQLDLSDPALEEKLSNYIIAGFRKSVEESSLNADVKKKMMYELTPGRSPDPTTGIEAGYAKIEALKEKGIDVAALHASGHRISSVDDVALHATLLNKESFDGVINGVVKRGPTQDAPENATGTSFAAAALASQAEADRAARLGPH